MKDYRIVKVIFPTRDECFMIEKYDPIYNKYMEYYSKNNLSGKYLNFFEAYKDFIAIKNTYLKAVEFFPDPKKSDMNQGFLVIKNLKTSRYEIWKVYKKLFSHKYSLKFIYNNCYSIKDVIDYIKYNYYSNKTIF